MSSLQEIYEALRDLDYCENQQDFSRRWLGRSEGYFAYLKSAKARPNTSSLGMLAAQIFAIIPAVDESSRYIERRRLRSAWVAAMTIWMGEGELQFGRPVGHTIKHPDWARCGPS